MASFVSVSGRIGSTVLARNASNEMRRFMNAGTYPGRVAAIAIGVVCCGDDGPTAIVVLLRRFSLRIGSAAAKYRLGVMFVRSAVTVETHKGAAGSWDRPSFAS